MFREILSNDSGVEWFGIISTLIFFSVFLVVIAMFFLRRPSYYSRMANLPLEDEGSLSSNQKQLDDEVQS